MIFRILFSFFLISTLFSCDFLQKKIGIASSLKFSDTVVDYHSVDVLPSFSFCDSILEVVQKNQCFKTNLYKHFSKSMRSHTFHITDTIDEVVSLTLMIDRNGVSKLVSIASSELVKNQIPLLDSLLRESVQGLPKLFPALKRGVPVPTVYEIPMVVKLD